MFVILGPPPCLRMGRMAPVVCSPKGRMRQLGFAELPGCLSVSSNDGEKGIAPSRRGWLLRLGMYPALIYRTKSPFPSSGRPTPSDEDFAERYSHKSQFLLTLTLGERLPRLALGFPPDAG